MAECYLDVSEVCTTMGFKCFQSVHTGMFSLRKSGWAKPTCYGHVALVCTTSKYLVVSFFVLFYCVLFSCIKMYFLGDIHFVITVTIYYG